MSYNTKNLGDYGERLACSFLEGKGYRILERNFRGSYGEIDIITISPESHLVFLEVKTRRSKRYGEACEAVDFRKREKIISTSMEYILMKNLDFQLRYDIIEVYPSSIESIRHIENAFGRE